MKYLNFIFLITLGFFACKNGGEEKAMAAEPIEETVSKKTADKAVEQLKNNEKVTLADNVKEKILTGKWTVAAWGSEEMRSTLGENYKEHKKNEETKTYEFKENGEIAVWQKGEVIESGSYSMATSGKDMKLELDGKRMITTLNFSSTDDLSLTWSEGNTSVTIDLKAKR